MVFTHTNQPSPLPINGSICITAVSYWCQGLRFRVGSLLVEALVNKIGKVNCAILNRESTTAILVNASTNVEGHWRDISYIAIRCPPHDRTSSCFKRSPLTPVHIPTIKGNLPQPNCSSDNQICANG